MTPNQHAVLAHVVVDPDAWYEHARNEFGPERAEEMMLAKVARWQPSYEVALMQPDYKTRAQRDQEERAKKLAQSQGASADGT